MDQQAKWDRARRILDAAMERAERLDPEGWAIRSQIEDIRLVEGYAEPGYGPTDALIAFGNWNPVSFDDGIPKGDVHRLPPKVGQLLERLGFQIEWGDEWSECCGCQRAVRTEPDSYSWTPSFWFGDDGYLCHACIKEDPSAYLEYLEGNEDAANTIGIDLEGHGYTKVETEYPMEHGWHPGQADDPRTVAASLRKAGVKRFIFEITGKGQFDTRFAVYVHEDEMELVPDLNEKAKRQPPGPTPGEQMAAALRSIPPDPAPGKPGVVYSVVDCDTGTAKTAKVSPEDWVAGRGREVTEQEGVES